MRKKICFIGALGVTLALCSKVMLANESDVTRKGFSTRNMVYISDHNTENIPVATDNYEYGRSSLYTAYYKSVETESDGTKTAYYTVFVESKIQSTGKRDDYGPRTFKNKKLSVNIEFEYRSDDLTLITSDSSNVNMTTYGYNKGFGWGIGIDISQTPGVNPSFQYNYSWSYNYSAVTVTPYAFKDASKKKYSYRFDYDFVGYKKADPYSPFAGEVVEKMSVTFSSKNAGSYADPYIVISQTSEFYKSASWPFPNGELSQTLRHWHRD